MSRLGHKKDGYDTNADPKHLFLYTVKRPKFVNGPKLRHHFYYDIFTGIKAIDILSISDLILIFCLYSTKVRGFSMFLYNLQQFNLFNKNVSKLGTTE